MPMSTSASFMPGRVSSMPGVSMTTTRCPQILASRTLIWVVHDWRPLPTFCFSDVMRLMNCIEEGGHVSQNKQILNRATYCRFPRARLSEDAASYSVFRPVRICRVATYAMTGYPDSNSRRSRSSLTGSSAISNVWN